MKRYITILITLIATATTAQVKFTQMERAAVKWNIPVAKRVVPGIPDFVMTYMTLANLIDSTEIELGTKIDSMKWATGDTLKLYTSDGVFKAKIVLTDMGTVKGTGVATRVAWWAGTDSLSSSANLYWDNSNSRLGIGTSSPSKQLTTTQDVSVNGLDIGLGLGNVIINVRVGSNALNNNTTGSGNIAIGSQSLFTNTTGSNNISNGYQSLYYNTTGSNNVALGAQSLLFNTTGGSNIANGSQALFNNTTGSNNVALGFSSLFSNSTGDNNVGNGAQSLLYNTTGSNNVANGYWSLLFNTTGSNNVADGMTAMQTNTTGSNNVALGFSSLFSNSTGNNNVALGLYAGYSETGSNKLYIENSTSSTPLIGGDFATDRVGINTPVSSIDQTLDVTGTMRITGSDGTATALMGRDGDGDVSAVGLGSGLAITGGTLNYTETGTGDITGITVSAPITGTSLTGPVPNIAADTSSTVSLATAYDLTLKENYITPGTTSQYWRGDKTWQTLNTTAVTEGTNLYYTDARSRSAISLTTTGTSGAATYNSGTGVLNVPNYATGATGWTTIGGTPNANGASISGSTLQLQPASASFGGVVTTGTQTFAGSKTFDYLGGTEGTNLTTGTSLIMATNAGKLENLYGTAAGYDLPLYNPTGNNWELTKLKTVNGNSLLGSGNVAISTDLSFTGASSPYTLNSNTGNDVTFAAGSGVTLSRSGDQLTIASSASGMTSWNLAASDTPGSESITNLETATIQGSTGIVATRSGSTVLITNTGDLSTINEGFLGVQGGGANSSVIRGFNFDGFTTGTGVTINAGTGLSIGETTSTNGGQITLTNAGVTSNIAGDGISVSGATGAVTISAQQINVGQGYKGTTSTVSFTAGVEQKVELSTFYTVGSQITTDNGNDRITVGATGQYMITYSIDVDLNSTTAGFTSHVKVSGSSNAASYKQYNNDTNLVPLSKTFYTDLTSGQYVELHISCTESISGNTLWQPMLTVQRVK